MISQKTILNQLRDLDTTNKETEDGSNTESTDGSNTESTDSDDNEDESYSSSFSSSEEEDNSETTPSNELQNEEDVASSAQTISELTTLCREAYEILHKSYQTLRSTVVPYFHPWHSPSTLNEHVLIIQELKLCTRCIRRFRYGSAVKRFIELAEEENLTNEEKREWILATSTGLKDIVADLYEDVFAKMLINYEILMETVPNQPSEYQSTPLVVMFRAAGKLLWYYYSDLGGMQHPDTMENNVKFFDCGPPPNENPYIRRSKLAATADNFKHCTMLMILTAMVKLESRWLLIETHPVLNDYLRALELALAMVVSRTFSIHFHNVVSMRVQVAPDSYYITDEAIFRLVLRLLVLRREFNSAFFVMNSIRAPPRFPFYPDAVQIYMLRSKIVRKCVAFDTDKFPDDCRKATHHMHIAPSDRPLFFKHFPTANQLEPYIVIEKYGNIGEWRRLAEFAVKTPEAHLARALSPVTTRACLMYFMDIACRQTIRTSWFNFYVSSQSLHLSTPDTVNDLRRSSWGLPKFCYVWNEACVLFWGELVSFGASPDSHFAAVLYWLHCIMYIADSEHRNSYNFSALYEYLMGSRFDPSVIPQASLVVCPMSHKAWNSPCDFPDPNDRTSNFGRLYCSLPPGMPKPPSNKRQSKEKRRNSHRKRPVSDIIEIDQQKSSKRRPREKNTLPSATLPVVWRRFF